MLPCPLLVVLFISDSRLEVFTLLTFCNYWSKKGIRDWWRTMQEFPRFPSPFQYSASPFDFPVTCLLVLVQCLENSGHENMYFPLPSLCVRSTRAMRRSSVDWGHTMTKRRFASRRRRSELCRKWRRSTRPWGRRPCRRKKRSRSSSWRWVNSCEGNQGVKDEEKKLLMKGSSFWWWGNN